MVIKILEILNLDQKVHLPTRARTIVNFGQIVDSGYFKQCLHQISDTISRIVKLWNILSFYSCKKSFVYNDVWVWKFCIWLALGLIRMSLLTTYYSYSKSFDKEFFMKFPPKTRYPCNFQACTIWRMVCMKLGYQMKIVIGEIFATHKLRGLKRPFTYYFVITAIIWE